MKYEPPTQGDWDRLRDYIGLTVMLAETKRSRIKGDREAILLDIRIDTDDTDRRLIGRDRFTHDTSYLGEQGAWLCATVRFYGSDRVDYRINAHALRDPRTRELIAPPKMHYHWWEHFGSLRGMAQDVCRCGASRRCSCEQIPPTAPTIGECVLPQTEAARRPTEARHILEEHGYTVTESVADGQHRQSQTDVPEEDS